MEVTLKNPRGSIKRARVLSEVMDEGWESWLKEYVSGLDPRDHFRFYSEAVGGF